MNEDDILSILPKLAAFQMQYFNPLHLSTRTLQSIWLLSRWDLGFLSTILIMSVMIVISASYTTSKSSSLIQILGGIVTGLIAGGIAHFIAYVTADTGGRPDYLIMMDVYIILALILLEFIIALCYGFVRSLINGRSNLE